ncbi:MAG: NAD(P)(+) transhydrogenase (Re/Si-specific) subunit beta [Chloroflexi bacterium]|nr:NAD(P)(+) transhydrogenase (Re/Si-specific) subunit beta [Chloroflexota bacterium]
MGDRILDLPLVIGSTYLVAATLLIVGLKLMNSPATARRGNLLASLGMLLAIGVTLLDRQIVSFAAIGAGVLVGTIIGAVFARTIKMTAMPQMVALFNGFGGGASAVIAISEFVRLSDDAGTEIPLQTSVTIMLGTLIGLVTLSGSFIAFGKLQEIVTTRPVTYPLQKTISGAMFLTIVAAASYLIVVSPDLPVFLALVAICLLFGVLLVIPIGGADMPVVISLLNSYSGIAAAAAGFVLNNTILIVGGALVGAAGLILTQIMTKAMHRSLANVIFGTFGAVPTGAAGAIRSRSDVREGDADDVAIMLSYAQSVIIVPGYGLAVAQAQHQVRELADLLEAKGVNVRYAIHPVAGRMPGHMNVLLAEANVPYDKLFDLDAINDDFERTDVAVVIGANDVTNPAARNATDSPIYGMPILNVDRARQVVVLKRSLSPGFAGIDNELFYKENTTMLFGDAKASVVRLVTAVGEVS